MSFRFQGKQVLLTYPKSGPLDKGLLHDFINHKLKEEADVKICHEKHQDGTIHVHACVQTKKRMDIKNANFLDYNGHHCNFTKPKTNDHWRNQVKYMEKEDPDVYGNIDVKNTKEEDFLMACDYVKQCKNKRDIYKPSPHLMVISSKVMFFENLWASTAQKAATVIKYKPEQFQEPMLTDLSISILVQGPSGIGKTQWALAHFEKPLLVSHMDKLKDFDPESHDGLVFDDMSFNHLHAEAIIHLLDNANDRDLHARYEIASIPAGTKKIFCHNKVNIFIPEKGVDEGQLVAIKRRYKLVQFHKSLF